MRLPPVLLLSAFLLAGCSGGAQDEHDGMDHGTGTASQTGPSTGPMAPGAPAGTPRTHESVMRDNRFVPADFTVNVGDTVHWVTEDVQAHNVVSESPADPFRSEDVSTVPVPPGRGTDFSHTFNNAGTIDYVCEYHAGMVGTVTVVAGNASS